MRLVIEMNSVSMLLINLIILLCPLMLYLFYCTYIESIEKEKNQTILDFTILSCLYLITTHYRLENNYEFIILLNIPLIIAMIKKRNFISFIISFVIVLIYYSLGAQLIYMVLQYIIYYIIYLILMKKKQNIMVFLTSFMIVKFIFLIIYYYVDKNFGSNTFVSIILIFVIFNLALYIILFLFQKGEDTVKLHMSIKEWQKDKQVRDSLFKITHEIKNPIAVCKSYLDMYDENNKEHKKYIPIIKDEIEKILLLLQDFLAMNKIKIQNEILDINLLLEEVVHQMSPVLDDKNIEFRYNISDEEFFIEGDYNRLNQVLINIIKNSVEAADYNKNPYILLKYEIVNDYFKIIIEDNGVGIAQDEIEKIKEPFYTTKKNGTGLGVSLSYEIINAHNGTIEYLSEFNEGTKVIISLPIINILD